MANENEHGPNEIIPPKVGFKVKIKDPKNGDGYIQSDASWGPNAVALGDNEGAWYYTVEEPCGMCLGCELGGPCESPIGTDSYLTVTNGTLSFSSTSSSTWTLSNKLLSANGATGYVEVSGNSLILGSQGHAAKQEPVLAPVER